MFTDPAIPFGSVKQSGYGQQDAPEGLDIYFETHVVYLDADHSRASAD
jgi:aldehyde dehydrogenase (NAD+)